MKDIDKIIVNDYRKESYIHEWDDIHYLSDEELLSMDAPTPEDIEVSQYLDQEIEYTEEDIAHLYQLTSDLSDILEDLGYCEKKIDDPKINYMDRCETRSEIVALQAQRQRIEAEIGEIKSKYVTRNRTIR